jgi:hypothetical protein
MKDGRNADGGFDLRDSVLLDLRSGSAHPRIASGRISNKVANAPGDPGIFKYRDGGRTDHRRQNTFIPVSLDCRHMAGVVSAYNQIQKDECGGASGGRRNSCVEASISAELQSILDHPATFV